MVVAECPRRSRIPPARPDHRPLRRLSLARRAPAATVLGECQRNRVRVAERTSHAYENTQQDQITDGQDSYRLAQATAGKGVIPLP